MAAKGNSLFERIARWELIDNALAPFITDLPHLKEAHAELQRKIAEAKRLEVQFEQMRSGWREASTLRSDLLRQGDELRGRLAAALQFEHGFKSTKLLGFGLKPRRDRGPGKKSTEKPPDATPPPKAVEAAVEPGGPKPAA